VNEIIMTSLRTKNGLNISTVDNAISKLANPEVLSGNFYKQLKKEVAENLLVIENDHAMLTKKGKFFADGIAARLFLS
jgi:oxygen-independent coproporphyrinogen III oxidase